jgi:hypothetical protein
MTCQIRMVNLPTCRTAISRKTAARTMTAMYVVQGWKCRVIGVGISEWFIRTARRRMLHPVRMKQEKDRVLLQNSKGFFDF